MFQGEVEEAGNEMRAAEEKAKKDITAAAKLAEELRSEQDLAVGLEKERKDLEGKVKTLSVQLDDAETSALKWGRKMAAKLDARARELEAEMDAEQRRTGDATKNLRKVERGIKEYIFKADEDKKNAERMQVRENRYIFIVSFFGIGHVHDTRTYH